MREAIGSEPYFSSHHVVAGGECWSRIDQIYAPRDRDVQYTVGDRGDIFPRTSTTELDHTMVDVGSKTVKPKRGTDLPRINETIFDDPAFVAKLHSVVVHMRLQIIAARPDGWRTGWEEIKVKLKEMCLEQTKVIKYRESKAVKRKRKLLKVLDALIQKGNACAQDRAEHTKLKKEIREANRANYTLHQTLEKEAYNMGKAHDRCTHEFFVPWHDTHAAQHVEHLAEAD